MLTSGRNSQYGVAYLDERVWFGAMLEPSETASAQLRFCIQHLLNQCCLNVGTVQTGLKPTDRRLANDPHLLKAFCVFRKTMGKLRFVFPLFVYFSVVEVVSHALRYLQLNL